MATKLFSFGETILQVQKHAGKGEQVFTQVRTSRFSAASENEQMTL